jgi:hypothetical protein
VASCPLSPGSRRGLSAGAFMSAIVEDTPPSTLWAKNRTDGDPARRRSSHIRRLLEFTHKLAKQILKVAGGMPD